MRRIVWPQAKRVEMRVVLPLAFTSGAVVQVVIFGPHLDASLKNLKTAIRDKEMSLGSDDFKSLYVETLKQMKGHTLLALRSRPMPSSRGTFKSMRLEESRKVLVRRIRLAAGNTWQPGTTFVSTTPGNSSRSSPDCPASTRTVGPAGPIVAEHGITRWAIFCILAAGNSAAEGVV